MLLTDTNFSGNYNGTKCPFYKNNFIAKDARIRCLNQFKDEEIKEVADGRNSKSKQDSFRREVQL